MNNIDTFDNYLQELEHPPVHSKRYHYLWAIPLLLISSYLLFVDKKQANPSNNIELQLSLDKIYLPVTNQFSPCSIYKDHKRLLQRVMIRQGSAMHYIIKLTPAQYYRLRPYLNQQTKLQIYPLAKGGPNTHEIIL